MADNSRTASAEDARGNGGNVPARRPKTQYARAGDVHIAFQTLGDGPADLLYVPGWVSNVEESWDEPLLARFLESLASFSRLILFDKRGTGLSDPVSLGRLPSLEDRMDDVRAVLEAAGSEQAAVFGASEGGSLAVLFAATYPNRTRALVTYGIFAKRVWTPDYPWAPRPEERDAEMERVRLEWAQLDVSRLAPSADEKTRNRLATYFRRSASPGTAVGLLRMNTQIDIREVLPAIRVPTLVLHRTGDLDSNVDEGRYIAKRIPGARFLELPGADHLPYVGDADAIVGEVEEFLTGARAAPNLDRVLTTVLFVDLVGSTSLAATLGDGRWRQLLTDFRAAMRPELDRWRGGHLRIEGDGLLATFDGPARAVRCAAAIRAAAHGLGLETRAGVHTGEVELVDGGVEGIAVHLGARVSAVAAPGEILTTGTVRDLVAGSGLRFDDRGAHSLKGVPGEWSLYSVMEA